VYGYPYREAFSIQSCIFAWLGIYGKRLDIWELEILGNQAIKGNISKGFGADEI
jgi:hypothetical protein